MDKAGVGALIPWPTDLQGRNEGSKLRSPDKENAVPQTALGGGRKRSTLVGAERGEGQ